VEEMLFPDLALAVSEVLANMAGYDRTNGSATQLSLTMKIADDDIVVRVEGAGLAQLPLGNPGPGSGCGTLRAGEGGRVVVVASLARSVSVDPGDDGGTSVSMVFDRCEK
jgi:anti-sigma regulatory factor (Ser/Thr protein kinase)